MVLGRGQTTQMGVALAAAAAAVWPLNTKMAPGMINFLILREALYETLCNTDAEEFAGDELGP